MSQNLDEAAGNSSDRLRSEWESGKTLTWQGINVKSLRIQKEYSDSVEARKAEKFRFGIA